MSIDNQGGKQETQEVEVIFMGLFWLQNISFEKMLAAKIIISALLIRAPAKKYVLPGAGYGCAYATAC